MVIEELIEDLGFNELTSKEGISLSGGMKFIEAAENITLGPHYIDIFRNLNKHTTITELSSARLYALEPADFKHPLYKNCKAGENLLEYSYIHGSKKVNRSVALAISSLKELQPFETQVAALEATKEFQEAAKGLREVGDEYVNRALQQGVMSVEDAEDLRNDFKKFEKGAKEKPEQAVWGVLLAKPLIEKFHEAHHKK